MTKHLAAARVEELLSKLGARQCTTRLVVASLITIVEANHFAVRADHVATVSFAHEVTLLVVECVVLVDRFGVFSQANADASNSARRASRYVVATWLADKG